MKKINRKLLVGGQIMIMAASLIASGAEISAQDVAVSEDSDTVDLIGYGMVVGLDGTGDRNIEAVEDTMRYMLQHYHVDVALSQVKSGRAAEVVVTASVGPYHKSGDKVDVTVYSIGDATSLAGGRLVVSALLGPDNEVKAFVRGVITDDCVSKTLIDGHEYISENRVATAAVPRAATICGKATVAANERIPALMPALRP